MIEIKKCAHCGHRGLSKISHPGCDSGFVHCHCGIKTDIFPSLAEAIDVWNARHEASPSEADRWLKEATEQRDRADKAEAERDELKSSLEQAKRMLSYSGEQIKVYTAKLKTRKRMEETIPRHEWGWWIDVCPGKTLTLRDATKEDLSRCILKQNTSNCHHDYFCEISSDGALVNRKAVANYSEQILPMSMDQYRIAKGLK